MIFAVTLEQAAVVLFAGGPGLVALVLQAMKHQSEAPIREANLAKTLTATAGEMLDRMQAEIDALKKELRLAEDQIIKLEAKIEASQKSADELAIERAKRVALELELARVRGYESGATEGSKKVEGSLERIEEGLSEAKEFRAEVADKLSESISRADAIPKTDDYGAAADAALRSDPSKEWPAVERRKET